MKKAFLGWRIVILTAVIALCCVSAAMANESKTSGSIWDEKIEMKELAEGFTVPE